MSSLSDQITQLVQDCIDHPRSPWPRVQFIEMTQLRPNDEIVIANLRAGDHEISREFLPEFLAWSLDGRLYPFEVSSILQGRPTGLCTVTLGDYRGPKKTN